MPEKTKTGIVKHTAMMLRTIQLTMLQVVAFQAANMPNAPDTPKNTPHQIPAAPSDGPYFSNMMPMMAVMMQTTKMKIWAALKARTNLGGKVLLKCSLSVVLPLLGCCCWTMIYTVGCCCAVVALLLGLLGIAVRVTINIECQVLIYMQK